MNSREIVKQYIDYAARHLTCLPDPQPGLELAILFAADDEVQVDRRRRRVRLLGLPGLGWLTYGKDEFPDGFDWIAIIPLEESFRVLFGNGSPFAPEESTLPRANGMILAMPVSQFQEAMEQHGEFFDELLRAALAEQPAVH